MRKLGWTLLTILFVLGSVTIVWSWPVPDTQQVPSYTDTFGEDNDYTINAMYYIREGLMVRDNVTGLVWELKEYADDVKDYNNPHDADNTYSWYDSSISYPGSPDRDGADTDTFLKQLNNARFGGYSDWRLPTIKELITIMDFNHSNPRIDTDFFTCTMAYDYWSSTTDYEGLIYVLNFGEILETDIYMMHGIQPRNADEKFYVMAVRGGRSDLTNHLVDTGMGAVTDINTGLMWYNHPANVMDWESALNFCESLSYPGVSPYTDWRLPTIKELLTVIDYDLNTSDHWAYNSEIFVDLFYDAQAVSDGLSCWTSTTYKENDACAWWVSFATGDIDILEKTYTDKMHAVPVRGGQPWIDGHLYITIPRQGAMLMTGSTHTITWEPAGIGGNVNIMLSKNGGMSYDVTIANNTPNTGTYSWTIPSSAASYHCMIKITPTEAGDVDKGTTQGMFTIGGSVDDPDDDTWDDFDRSLEWWSGHTSDGSGSSSGSSSSGTSGSSGSSSSSDSTGSMPRHEDSNELLCFISTARL